MGPRCPPSQGLKSQFKEVTIMNFHLSEHQYSNVFRSLEFFIAMLVIISLLGVVFLAAA